MELDCILNFGKAVKVLFFLLTLLTVFTAGTVTAQAHPQMLC